MKRILVYADWDILNEITLLGELRCQPSRGGEVVSFEYSSKWLDSGFVHSIDPSLEFYQGPQYLSDSKPNFGMFLDSSPDRWGRNLIKRRQVLLARESGLVAHHLLESDYLLAVDDETRMGGLRMKLKENGPFLDSNSLVKVPPMSSIRELEQASLRIEDENFMEDENAKKWLQLIIAPGSSLGGARPKASVRHLDGSLWIAKFPSKNDEYNTGAWEYLVNSLASKLNITIAVADLAKFSEKGYTFLTKRFDRTKDMRRIHYASALTLLGYNDGYSYSDGASYLEILDLIRGYGANPEKDSQELWRRIVFSVGVSNTDDHLRNHGFLLGKNGWSLSPAFDINPNHYRGGLSLNIDENDNSLDFELCLSVAEYFRWDLRSAKEYIAATKKVVSSWAIEAKRLNISKYQQEIMGNAFFSG